MNNVYSSGDYAGLSGGKYSFYYGYEEILCPTHGKKCPDVCPDGDWAFVAYKDDVDGNGSVELLRFSSSELGVRNGDDPKDGLLAGIAKTFEFFSKK